MSAIPLDFKSNYDNSAFQRAMQSMQSESAKTARGVMAGMDAMEKKLSKFGIALSGGAIAAGFGAAFNAIGDHVDRIQDLSGALGLSTEQFQRLSGAVALSGVDGEKFAGAMTKLNAKIADALDGNKPAIESFRKLGISVAQLGILSPDEVLLRMADGLKESKDSAAATAAAFDILGNKAARMVGALQQGGDSFKSTMDKVSVASAENLERIDRLGDGFTRLKTELMGAGAAGLGGFLKYAYEASPAISRITEALVNGRQELIAFRGAAELMRDLKGPDLQASMPGIPGAADRFGGMPKAGKLADSGFSERQKAMEEMLKVNQELNGLQRAFYVDGLEGEEKLAALEKDRTTLMDQRITAGQDEVANLTKLIGLKDLEIQKEKAVQAIRERTSVINRISGAMGEQRSKLSGLQDDQLNFEQMGNDGRREFRRQERRDRQARDRIARVADSRENRGGRDARPGSNAIANKITMSEEMMRDLARLMAEQLKLLIPQQ